MIVELAPVSREEAEVLYLSPEKPAGLFLRVKDPGEFQYFINEAPYRSLPDLDPELNWRVGKEHVRFCSLAGARSETLEAARASFLLEKEKLNKMGDQTWVPLTKSIREWEGRTLPPGEAGWQFKETGKIDDSKGIPSAQVWIDTVIIRGFWLCENGVLRRAPR